MALALTLTSRQPIQDAGDLPPTERETPLWKGWGRRLEMGLVDRLKAIIDGMPDGGSVSLPVTWLRNLLDAEGDSGGMDRLLTLEEAGSVVGRSPGTVRTWANSGQPRKQRSS